MSALTDFAENKVLDAVLRGQALGAPATLYVGLFTANPTDVGGGTEVTGGSYARVAVTASLANWSGSQAAGIRVLRPAIRRPGRCRSRRAAGPGRR